jgi:hypothetical protein
MTKRTKFFNDTHRYPRTSISNPLIRGAAIFLIGLIIGWFVLGWAVFPVRYTNVYPNELRPEVLNDYLLMTAESYAATGDLRTAAKRLKYWEPEDLAVMFNDLAISIETANPAGAAYLRILAQDLHLSSIPTSSTTPPPARNFEILWLLLFLIIALVVLAALIKIAQRMGVLGPQPAPQFAPSSQPAQPAPPVEQHARPEADQPAAPLAIPAIAEIGDDDDDFYEEEDEGVLDVLDAEDFAPEDLGEQETIFAPEETPPMPPTNEIDETANEKEQPESEPLPPQPPLTDTDEDNLPTDEETPFATRVFRFDGTSSYNTIAAIEMNDEYLGEYGLSAGQTAPDNSNLALTLEVWLFDKSDTQTVEAALVPAVVANDPSLRARYVDEDVTVIPLQTGQIILLETAELRLEGRIRRVEFGPATSDGVPVVNYAEIEMLGRRK